VLIGSQASVKCIQTRLLIFILLRGFSIYPVLFQPLYRPSSGCTLSYYKANHTKYNVFVFVKETSCTSVKFAFKIITAAVELKSYSNIKGINSIKSCLFDLGRREYGAELERGISPV